MALLLFRQIASLFLIVLGGFFLTKLRILKAEDSKTLSYLCIYLATPCVIVRAFQIELTPQVLSGFLLCVTAALGVHLLMLLLGPVWKRAGLSGVERASVGYANSGNLIVPLVTLLRKLEAKTSE